MSRTDTETRRDETRPMETASPARQHADSQHADSQHADRGSRHTMARRRSWRDWVASGPGAAAIVGTIAGVFLLVVAIVTLARTGVPANDLTVPKTVVGAFTRTPLMGLIELIGGLAFLGLGTAGDGRGLAFLGLVTGVFGIVWLIEPGAFQTALGVGVPTAWLYLVIGIASAIAGLFGTAGTASVRTRRIEV